MVDEPRILAIAPQDKDRQLRATFAFAAGSLDEPAITLLDPWQGSAKTSLSRQLFAMREVLFNILDQHRPTTIAVRRPDGGRGGPSLAYDAKVSFAAVSGLVAVERSLVYEDYRGNQLQFRPDDAEVQLHCPTDPKGRRDSLSLAAIATALTALGRASGADDA